MPRIFITGDTHGSIELKRLSNKNFPIARNLTKEDVVIICGDAGFMWDNTRETKYWDDWAEDRPFTIISCFGNHSNYNKLRSLPITEWSGAKVRKVRPHVMYVENGEIITLNNKTFFCMGGATSVDRAFRKEGRDWWPEEIPSKEEYELAAANLEKHNYQVDYIFTHTGPNSTIDKLSHYYMEHDELTTFLENYVKRFVAFKFWYIGHFHEDRTIDDKYWFLYRDIIEIEG